ncbi:sugar transporter [Moniliophthora roreri]|nr:sugar transporter [Moniliophthora roreri]
MVRLLPPKRMCSRASDRCFTSSLKQHHEDGGHKEERRRHENRSDLPSALCGYTDTYGRTYPFAVELLADPSGLVVTILITGARMPVIRLNAEHNASPVPRWGAGKTSAVRRSTYSIPGESELISKCTGKMEKPATYCVKPEAQENPRTAAWDLLVVNKNKKTPLRAVETAIVSLRPPKENLLLVFRVQSTTRQAMMEPGTPRMDMMV